MDSVTIAFGALRNEGLLGSGVVFVGEDDGALVEEDLPAGGGSDVAGVGWWWGGVFREEYGRVASVSWRLNEDDAAQRLQ
jgi:hypothetical protein